MGSNPLDWSLGRHTAARGRVWGGSRSVPQWCKGEGNPLSSVSPFLKGVVYNNTVSMLLQSGSIYMCTQSDIKSCFKKIPKMIIGKKWELSFLEKDIVTKFE